VIALFGIATVPGVMALDRGNSVALAAAPMLVFLVFLVALRRGTIVSPSWRSSNPNTWCCF